ncbi:MAG TPA: hypothetical protein VFN53_09545 [Acidobacteriaceae bacterium]|nr:hypothetical protein [Acidobacteriaceae bacterium]
MQTFYVTLMAVVFVLCFALFTTARRVLRGSPLQSGELSLATLDGFANLSDEPEQPHWQYHPSEADESDGPAVPRAAEAFIEQMRSAERPLPEASGQTLSAEDLESPEIVSERVTFAASAELIEPVPPRSKGRSGTVMPKRKLSPPAYTYMLEMLLIGVSAVVLVRTQRSTARYRASHGSRSRVA